MAGLGHLPKDLLEGWQHAYAAHEVQQVCVRQQGSLTCRKRARELNVKGFQGNPNHLFRGWFYEGSCLSYLLAFFLNAGNMPLVCIARCSA